MIMKIFFVIVIFTGILIIICVGEYVRIARLHKDKIKNEITIMYKDKQLLNRQYLYDVSYLWMRVFEKQLDIKDFFVRNNIKRVAIYGMGRLGLLLEKIINSDEVKVDYGIDRNCEKIKCNIPILSPDDKLPEVQCVIVMVSDYEEVKDTIGFGNECRLLKIKDILELIIQESEL